MNEVLQRLVKLDPRLARLLIGAVCFVALFEVWVVLRGPMTELRQLADTTRQLTASAANDRANAAELERLTTELETLERQIGEAGPEGGSDDARVPQLMTMLEASATRHGVHLGAVRPPARRPVAGFDEIGYGVEARGDYLALFGWLREVSQQSGPLVVSGFVFKAVDEGQRLALSLRLAAYRPSGAPSP